VFIREAPYFQGRYFNVVFEQAAAIRANPIATGARHMKRFVSFMFCLFLLSGCLKPKEVEWLQKLTLYIETPLGEVVASSVYKINVGDDTGGLFDLPGGKPLSFRVTGEAVVVNLPNGRYLFALMKGKTSSGNTVAQTENAFADVAPELRNEKRAPYAKRMERVKLETEARVLPAKAYPMLVTFDDVTDPKTVRLVDPADLAASFGAGYALRKVTLEITREPVTTGVVEGVLGWLEDIWPNRLDGDRYGNLYSTLRFANSLSTGNFSTEISK